MPFRDIIGQEKAVAILQRALKTGRVAHAYLFAGPEGVGKRTTALALAQALNCENGVEDGCGSCRSCRKIREHLHPDVRVIEPEGATLKIDQIRELKHEVALKPYEGRRKVFILDRAERMTEPGGNAFLKTLEEPAGEAVLILVTSNASALLPTILSRCQEVRFPPIPPGPLSAFLEKKRGLDPGRARLLACLSGGSLGLALKMDAKALLEERDRIIEGAFEAIKMGGSAILEFAESWAKDREGLDGALGHLASYIRDILAFQLTKREDLLFNGDRAEEIRCLAALLPTSTICSFFEAVALAKEGVLRNWNLKLCMEVMLLKARKAILDVGCQMVDVRELEGSPASSIQHRASKGGAMAELAKISLGKRYGTETEYYYSNSLELKIGEAVVVEAEWGMTIGFVTRSYKPVSAEKLLRPVRAILKRADPEDLLNFQRIKEREEEAKTFCKIRIRKRGLSMRLSDVKFSLDGSKATFYFTAEGRVDFRELVRDLVHRLRTRVELKQIGARDEASILGCLGPCGRTLCCKSFLKAFQPIAIRMAKDQGLSLNPERLAGMCGRLKCCLAYEHQVYEQLKAGLPRVGTPVDTAFGPGLVKRQEILAEAVVVELPSGEERRFSRAELLTWATERWDEEGPPSCGGGGSAASPPCLRADTHRQASGGGEGGAGWLRGGCAKCYVQGFALRAQPEGFNSAVEL